VKLLKGKRLKASDPPGESAGGAGQPVSPVHFAGRSQQQLFSSRLEKGAGEGGSCGVLAPCSTVIAPVP